MTSVELVKSLGVKIANGNASTDEIAEFVNVLLLDAVTQLNESFSPRNLVKNDRTAEPLPTDPRKLSSYRTRLGTMLEYALCVEMDKRIEGLFGTDLRLTFAVAHEYPDFYVRDAVLGRRVRIEMKAVDADSEEQAARFEVLSSLIHATDVVVLIGWEWKTVALPNKTPCEFPAIFSFVVVPSSDLAQERDKSVTLRGGQIEIDKILVKSKTGEGLTKDKGNAGKILRLIHSSRRAEPFKLSLHIIKYLQFTDEVRQRVKVKKPRKTRSSKFKQFNK